jgi:anti-sigma factor ChrR (cupin superfamily)
MRHDEAVLLLTDLLGGRLPDPVRVAVEAHVAACDECRRLADAHAALSRAEEPHPSSAAIVAHALHPGDLPPAEAARIAAHLTACPRCSEEINLVRRAERAAVSSTTTGAAGRSWHAARVLVWGAAAAAMLLLLTPAYLGLRRVARLPPIVRVQSLADEVRGPVGPQIVSLLPTDTHAFLAVEPPSPAPGAADTGYLVEILDAGGAVAWSAEVTAAALRQRPASSPELVLAVPAGRLRAGPYILRLRRPATGDDILLRIPFEVRIHG